MEIFILIIVVGLAITIAVSSYKKQKRKERSYLNNNFTKQIVLEKPLDLHSEIQKENIDNLTKSQLTPNDIEIIIEQLAREGINVDYSETEFGNIVDLNNLDPMFDEAARLVVIHQSGSTSLIQRKFAFGYNRAGRLMDQIEAVGILGPSEGSKPRQVLVQDEYQLEQILSSLRGGNFSYLSSSQRYSQEQIDDVRIQYASGGVARMTTRCVSQV